MARDIIKRPLLTERGAALQESQNKYLFEVRSDANKLEVKSAVEAMFDVKVAGVNTLNFRGKIKRMGRFQGRRRGWKKAVVTLAEGEAIEFFEGV
jgi:large subunit ribosomal protein L23